VTVQCICSEAQQVGVRGRCERRANGCWNQDPNIELLFAFTKKSLFTHVFRTPKKKQLV
jgi:hypothetical protein